MIVFIASILVAAVAAFVLIDTSSKLQQRSAQTGQEVTEEVGTNLKVEGFVGLRDNSGQNGLQDLEVYVALAPGSRDLDLTNVKIQMLNSTKRVLFNYTQGANGPSTYNASAITDGDSSFSAARPALTSGDLVVLQLNLAAAGMSFLPRETVTVTIWPEIGNSVEVQFSTPNSYGTATVIPLG